MQINSMNYLTKSNSIPQDIPSFPLLFTENIPEVLWNPDRQQNGTVDF